MGYGFHMGRLLAALLCDDRAPASLSLFDANRFAESDHEASKPGASSVCSRPE
jgi:hypothetical protein